VAPALDLNLKGTATEFWAWNGPAHPETLALQRLDEVLR
jgi:hypothetical protein